MSRRGRKWLIGIIVAGALCVGVFALSLVLVWGIGFHTEILPPAFSADGKEVFFIERNASGFFFGKRDIGLLPDFSGGARIEVTSCILGDRVSIRRLHIDSGRIETIRSWPGPLDRHWIRSNLAAPFGRLAGGFDSRWGRPGYVVAVDYPLAASYGREGLWDRRSGKITDYGQWRRDGGEGSSADARLATFRDSRVTLWHDCAFALYDGRTQTSRLLFRTRGCDTRQAVKYALDAGRRAAAKAGTAEEKPELGAIREGMIRQARARGLDEYDAKWSARQQLYDQGYFGRPEGWRTEILSPEETASVRLAQQTEFDLGPYIVVSDAELSSFPDVEEAIRNPGKRVDRAGYYYAPGERECAVCEGLRVMSSQRDGFIENNGRVYRIRLLKALAPGEPDARSRAVATEHRTADDLAAAKRSALEAIAKIPDEELRQAIRTIVEAADTHFESLRGASVVRQQHLQVWRAKVRIPAARDCRVLDSATPYGDIFTYWCTDGLPGLRYLAAGAALRAYAGKVQRATGLDSGPLSAQDDMAIFRYPSGAFIQLQLAPVMESRRDRLEILIEAPRSF